MITLSIPQPWASLIVNGVCPVNNRRAPLKARLPQRVLIYAQGFKVPRNFEYTIPEEHCSLVRQALTCGNIGDLQRLPLGAIIGWADVVRIDEHDKNHLGEWGDRKNFGLVMENAHVFDKPIKMHNRQDVFEYEMDWRSLPPSHESEVRVPKLKGNEFLLPLNENLWNEVTQGLADAVTLDLTKELRKMLVKPKTEYDLRPIKTLRITCGTKVAVFQVKGDSDIYPYSYTDAPDKPYLFTNLAGEKRQMWTFVRFELGKRLK